MTFTIIVRTVCYRWWHLAAADGSRKGSVMAQVTLGYYYSQPDTRDLQQAFYWHNLACGNGSLESQGENHFQNYHN